MEIDLTGRLGLARKHFGESSGLVKPNLRYDAENGEMVSGFFNPMRHSGYLSPSNISTIPVTSPSKPKIIGSTIYNDIEHKGYFGERGSKIYEADGLDDLSLALLHTVDSIDAEDVEIVDMEIYQLEGKRRLFYTYNRDETTEDGDTLEEHGDIGILNLEEVLALDLPQGTRNFLTEA